LLLKLATQVFARHDIHERIPFYYRPQPLFFVEGNYLARMQPDITPKMRGVLIDWCVRA
jgi:hypothetical protein